MDELFGIDNYDFGETDKELMKSIMKKAQAEQGTMSEKDYSQKWTLMIRKILGS